MFNNKYFEINENGISPFQTMLAYMGGSAFQTVIDNPITSYRQLVQQYAKDLNGNQVSPKIARKETNKIFKKKSNFCFFIGINTTLNWSRF